MMRVPTPEVVLWVPHHTITCMCPRSHKNVHSHTLRKKSKRQFCVRGTEDDCFSKLKGIVLASCVSLVAVSLTLHLARKYEDWGHVFPTVVLQWMGISCQTLSTLILCVCPHMHVKVCQRVRKINNGTLAVPRNPIMISSKLWCASRYFTGFETPLFPSQPGSRVCQH